MLDSIPYPFKYKGVFSSSKDGFKKLVYTFYGKERHKYIFEAEYRETLPNLYAVKFYDSAHKKHENKFGLMTKADDVLKMISTFKHILNEIIEKNPLASFAFIGAPQKGEVTHPNKRYRVWYGTLLRIFKGVSTYKVYRLPEKSRALFFCSRCEPAEVRQMMEDLLSFPE